jgi:hypothetical protein
VRTRSLALVLAAALLLTACQRGEPEVPAATLAEAITPEPVDTAPSRSPSPSPSLPPVDYSIPPVIDAAYAERVLDALYAIETEAVREMMRSGAITDRATNLVRAAYVPGFADFRTSTYQDEVDSGWPGVLPTPGDGGFSVDTVLSASAPCTFVGGRRDATQVLVAPTELPGVTYVQLVPKVEGADPEQLNPTPWMIASSLHRFDSSVPEDPCAP